VKYSRQNSVIVLDRDGTIVIDRHYLSDPADLEFMPGAAESLRWLHENGYRLVIVTNQSGVGRGMFSLDHLNKIHGRLIEMVRSAGARLEGIYYCPHTPENGCSCRKPAPGLLIQAAFELGFDPSSAVVVGDKLTDIEFGKQAGAITILLATSPPPPNSVMPDYIASNLLEATRTIHTLRSID
jgi:D-glycero-D-manno-heptose 1,7-bisphosphate phosphatase